MRNEFRDVQRLRGMKCFPGGETQFAGNTFLLYLMIAVRPII